MADLTDIRLKKKGQLADLSARRRTLAAQADNLLITIISKSDTIADAADLDTEGMLQAAEDLHRICSTIRETDKTIKKLHDELHG